jgi:hypothetical protein
MNEPARIIKPIETIYKEYRFRSRLEARYAVYFDSVGITWEYEREGYDLGGGLFYLPDFWLPQVMMWAEVKPTKLTDIEMEKIKRLVFGTGYGCILLEGFPESKPYDVTSASWIESDEEIHARCYTVALTNYHGYLTDEGRFYSCPCDDEVQQFDDTIKAVKAAKQARFEHGECG